MTQKMAAGSEGVKGECMDVCGVHVCVSEGHKILQDSQGLADWAILDREPLIPLQALPVAGAGTETKPSWMEELL